MSPRRAKKRPKWQLSTVGVFRLHRNINRSQEEQKIPRSQTKDFEKSCQIEKHCTKSAGGSTDMMAVLII